MGTVRTLMNVMKKEGLIKTTANGAILTGKGEKTFPHGKRIFVEKGIQPLTVSEHGKGMLLRDFKGQPKPLEIRDAAVVCGGTGATTLVEKEGVFVFDPPMDVGPKVKMAMRKLSGDLNPNKGDILIIVSGDSLMSVESAIWGVFARLAKEA